MRRLKISLALLLSLCFSIFPVLTSCTAEPVNEAEFVASAKDLLKRAEKINNAYLTETGIPVKMDKEDVSKYKEIDKQGLQDTYGFSSLSAIDTAIEEVFDEATADWFLSYMHDTDGYDSIKILPYIVSREPVYTTSYDANGKPVTTTTYAETEMRYTGDFTYLSDLVSFDTDSVRFVGTETRNGRQYATVTVNVTVTATDGKKENRNSQKFDFVKEDGAWQLADAVYYRYVGSHS